MKKKVSLFDFKVGDVLDRDIFNETGILLLPSGTELTEPRINKLLQIGITEVFVEETVPAPEERAAVGRETSQMMVTLSGEIPGNLCQSGYAEGNLLVSGNISGNIQVIAEGDITVNGDVIDATLVSKEGDIIIGGGIRGNGNGKVTSSGSIQATFAESAELRTGNDLNLSHYLTNCQVECLGNIIVRSNQKGEVHNSRIVCSGTILVDNLGDPDKQPVQIEVRDLRRIMANSRLEEINSLLTEKIRNVKRLKKLVDMLQVMGDKVKKLDPATKKKLVEQTKLFLQYKKEIEQHKMEKDGLLEKIRTLDAQRRYFVTVLNKIYPGVEIVIGNAKIKVHEESHRVAFYKKGIIVMKNLDHA